MIVNLKDIFDKIYAYAEFEIVDESTRICDEGKYIYVQDIWINPDYRWTDCFSELVRLIFANSKNAEFVFWRRNKTGKDSGILLGSKFLKYIEKAVI